MKWFSREIIIKLDVGVIELKSAKYSDRLSPYIEFDTKGKVLGVGNQHKTRSDSQVLHVFEDTFHGIHYPLIQSFFEYLKPKFIFKILRPKILLIPSRNFLDKNGLRGLELLVSVLVISMGSEVVVCTPEQKPFARWIQTIQGAVSNITVGAISDEHSKRALEGFKLR